MLTFNTATEYYNWKGDRDHKFVGQTAVNDEGLYTMTFKVGTTMCVVNCRLF